MNFRTNKFKQAYSTPNKGRSDTTLFTQSRLWHQNTAPKVWTTYNSTKCKFLGLWGDPNISKTHFAVTFGEALPFIGNNAILVHTNNLVEQHSSVLDHYKKIGFVEKNWQVFTIHQMYHWVKNLEAGNDIDDEHKQFILNLEYCIVDECHKYSKGDDTKMFVTVMDYLFKYGKMKLVLGTSATMKYIDKIWKWAGTFVDRNKYTFRPDPKDLHQEGWTHSVAEYLHVDSKTKVFDRQLTDSINVRADDPTFDQYCQTLYNTDPDNALDNLAGVNHELKFRTDEQFRIEQMAYQDNRFNVAIDHWIKKKLGKPAIINVRGVRNAQYYEALVKAKINKLGYDIIYWNGEAKSGEDAHPIYKNNERKMLDHLVDPTHPLKLVITNGMLREGTNESIDVVYQCAFTPGGGETSLQVGSRAPVSVIMLDAANCAKLPGSNYQQELKATLAATGIDRTPEELMAIECEQRRDDAKTPNHRSKSVLNKIADAFWEHDDHDPQTTDEGTNYHTLLSEDMWVKEVIHNGNLKTKSIGLHNNHQTLMEALDIAQEA